MKETVDLRYEMDKNMAIIQKSTNIRDKIKIITLLIYPMSLEHHLNVLTSINQLIKNLCKKEVFITPEKLSYYMDSNG